MSRRSTNTTRNSVSMRFVINFLSFLVVTIIGIVLIFSKLSFAAPAAEILETIAQSLAFLVVIFSSFYYARSKRNVWFLVVWAIGVVLIVTSYFI